LTSHVDELICALRDTAVNGEIMNLKPFLFDFTLGTTTKLIFGESLTTIPKEDRDAFRDAFDYASSVTPISGMLAHIR
jgi:hypothetical protein